MIRGQTIQAAQYKEDEPHFLDDHDRLLKTQVPEGAKEHERLLAIHRKKQREEKENPC